MPVKPSLAGYWVPPLLHQRREGGRRGGREETRGEETYKLLTGIYELIVSDCKHNNNLPVSACLLIERGTETDRKNVKGVGDGEKVRQQNELTMKEQGGI